jgi:hypothetical protein
MELLKTVSREEVDKELTRCPNAEISAKMADVRLIAELRSLLSPFVLTLRAHPPLPLSSSASARPRPTWTRSAAL